MNATDPADRARDAASHRSVPVATGEQPSWPVRAPFEPGGFAAARATRPLTPRGVQAALRTIGLDWTAGRGASGADAHGGPVGAELCAQVPAFDPRDPLDREILCAGAGRVESDAPVALCSGRWGSCREHGHGSGRTDSGPAEIVHGPVRTALQPGEVTDLARRFEGLDLPERGRQHIATFLGALVAAGPIGPVVDLVMVEWFVLRLAIQVDQTGTPVRSQHAATWANTSAADWTVRAVRRLWAHDRG